MWEIHICFFHVWQNIIYLFYFINYFFIHTDVIVYFFLLLIFFKVGSMLINRVANTDMTWHQEVTNAAPRVSPIVDLTLDDSPVLRAIDNLNFIQMKRKFIV